MTRKQLVRISMVVAVIAALMLVVAGSAFAITSATGQSECLPDTGQTGMTATYCTGDAAINVCNPGYTLVLNFDSDNWVLTQITDGGGFVWVRWDTNRPFANSAGLDCIVRSSSSPSEPEATPIPAIWLAGVCEPEDGFSTPEYGSVITIGSDANALPYGTTLYAGASIDGPWVAVGVPGPPYILTRDQVLALTDSLGLGDYHELWLKVSGEGQPANLGSMIADREQHMDVLCNPE